MKKNLGHEDREQCESKIHLIGLEKHFTFYCYLALLALWPTYASWRS